LNSTEKAFTEINCRSSQNLWSPDIC